MRLGPDTNVWSVIAVCDEGEAFERMVSDRRILVVLPPGVLLEMLRTSDIERRRRIVEVLTGAPRQHLAGDAELDD